MGRHCKLIVATLLVFAPLFQAKAAPILIGDVVLSGFPPLIPNLRPGFNENAVAAYLIPETFASPAPPGLGLPLGTLVDTWLIHSDAVSPPTGYLGLVRFDRRIVSVASTPAVLRNRDSYVVANGGPLPFSAYMGPGHPAFAFRGLEGGDAFEIAPGSFGPRAIRFRMVTGNVIDELRITTISAIPEPGTSLMVGLGLIGVLLVRRRRHRFGR